ncbi:MAG: PHP domain-containing protein [Denitrovibrio sp.]|nr:MAG: PHP domain-containing protein [Denitrovibrio sp.]
MIDLHTHSTFSDGTMTPEQLVKYAEKKDIEVIALTDHDTIDGVESFLAVDSPVERVAGVEISVSYSPGTFHMVGLFIDHTNPFLLSVLEKMKKDRRVRNKRLLEMVGKLVGRTISEYDISLDNDGELGRPHIAKFLVKEGFAVNINDAFTKYLGENGEFFIEKERLDFHGGVQAIHEAGGVAILAHPLTLDVDEEKYSPFIKYLKSLGLDGIEVWCSDTPAEKFSMFETIAKEHDMLVSGGSDFHGDINLRVGLGTGKGSMNIPYSVYSELKKKASR